MNRVGNRTRTKNAHYADEQGIFTETEAETTETVIGGRMKTETEAESQIEISGRPRSDTEGRVGIRNETDRNQRPKRRQKLNLRPRSKRRHDSRRSDSLLQKVAC